ncbi:MAG: hypothetical protein V3V08_23605 [Nannocystaceae bacterium]
MPTLPTIQRTPTINPTPLGLGGLETAGQLARQGIRAAGEAVGGVLEFASQVAGEQQASHDAIQLSAFRFDMQDLYGSVLAKAKQGKVSHPGWMAEVETGLITAHENLMTGGLLDGVSPFEQQKAALFSMQQIEDRKGEAATFQMAQTRAMSDLVLDNGVQRLSAQLLLDPSSESLDSAIKNWDALLFEHSSNRDMDDLARRLVEGNAALINTAVRAQLAIGNYDAAIGILHDPDNSAFLTPDDQNVLFKMEIAGIEKRQEDDIKAAEDETWRGGIRGIKAGEIRTEEAILDLGLDRVSTNNLLVALRQEDATSNDRFTVLAIEQLQHEGDMDGARDLIRRSIGSRMITVGWGDAKLASINASRRGDTKEKAAVSAYAEWDRSINRSTSPDFVENATMSPIDLEIRRTDEIVKARVFREQNPNATEREIQVEQRKNQLAYKQDILELNKRRAVQFDKGTSEVDPKTEAGLLRRAQVRLEAVKFDENKLSLEDRLILDAAAAAYAARIAEESLGVAQ